MKIAYITAGAAGMYCGTCLHDNTLAAALMEQGHEVSLTPTYTPPRTDDPSVAIDHIFFGAVNVYPATEGAVLPSYATLSRRAARQQTAAALGLEVRRLDRRSHAR